MSKNQETTWSKLFWRWRSLYEKSLRIKLKILGTFPVTIRSIRIYARLLWSKYLPKKSLTDSKKVHLNIKKRFNRFHTYVCFYILLLFMHKKEDELLILLLNKKTLVNPKIHSRIYVYFVQYCTLSSLIHMPHKYEKKNTLNSTIIKIMIIINIIKYITYFNI